MQVDVGLLLSAIAVSTSFIGLVLAYVKYIRAQEKRITRLEDRSKDFDAVAKKLDALIIAEEDKSERIKALETKMELWWTAMQSTVVKMLKHPTQKRRDLLLDKLEAKTVTLDEMAELRSLLQCDASGKKKEDALVAAMAIARIDMLIYDMKRTVAKTTITITQGPQGIQGVQGVQGIAGTKGEKGEKGESA